MFYSDVLAYVLYYLKALLVCCPAVEWKTHIATLEVSQLVVIPTTTYVTMYNVVMSRRSTRDTLVNLGFIYSKIVVGIELWRLRWGLTAAKMRPITHQGVNLAATSSGLGTGRMSSWS